MKLRDFRRLEKFAQFNILLRNAYHEELWFGWDMERTLEELDLLAVTPSQIAEFGVLLDDIKEQFNWDFWELSDVAI
jgi:hypothetical protein